MESASLGRVAKRFPIYPPHPERICWGCERLCPVTHMVCGNGKERTEHPSELFGEGWYDEPILPLQKHDAFAGDDADAVSDTSSRASGPVRDE